MRAARRDGDDLVEAVGGLGVDGRIAATDEDRGLARLADARRLGDDAHRIGAARDAGQRPERLPRRGRALEHRTEREGQRRQADGGSGDRAGRLGAAAHEPAPGDGLAGERAGDGGVRREAGLLRGHMYYVV